MDFGTFSAGGLVLIHIRGNIHKTGEPITCPRRGKVSKYDFLFFPSRIINSVII